MRDVPTDSADSFVNAASGPDEIVFAWLSASAFVHEVALAVALLADVGTPVLGDRIGVGAVSLDAPPTLVAVLTAADVDPATLAPTP